MRTCFLCISLLLSLLPALLLTACDKTAQSAHAAAIVAAAGPNAADLYLPAWSKISKDLDAAASDVVFGSGGVSVRGSRTWDETAQILQQNQPVVNELMKATMFEHCDFGVKAATNKEDMVSAMQLSTNVRHAARLLNADAARAWASGDIDGAVDRVAAVYGLMAHSSRVHVAVNGLVNAAVLSLAAETTESMTSGAGGRALSAAQRDRLRRALARLDSSDPAGLLAAAKAEGLSHDTKIERSQRTVMAGYNQARRALGQM